MLRSRALELEEGDCQVHVVISLVSRFLSCLTITISLSRMWIVQLR